MTLSATERKQIENEMIFRRVNERIVKEMDQLDEALIAEGNSHLIRDDDHPIHFICECADENCVARIPLRISLYQKIHSNRATFIIKPGHLVAKIENPIIEKDNYAIVRKVKTIEKPGKKLNKTPTNHV